MESDNGSRVNLRELRFQMEKRVGSAQARQYFSYLTRLLSKKLTKTEFDKLCILTLGQENLFLHNQLIQSVFRNACQERVGRPDRALEPAPSVWCNGSVVTVSENGEPDVSDLKPLVKRQKVEENTDPVPGSVRGLVPSIVKVVSSRSFCGSDFLVSDEELKSRLDDIARENGLDGGATLECAQLLNNGLDLYLRRVIGSCLDLVRSRGKQINGSRNGTVSIQDFRVAMEINPQQLGRNWPLLLEKLSCLWFEVKD